MKTIYVNPTDFTISMDPIEDYIETTAEVFDDCSDDEIEKYRYIPNGYRWINPLDGKRYSGLAIMPIHGMAESIYESYGQSVSELQKKISELEQANEKMQTELSALYKEIFHLNDEQEEITLPEEE